MIVFLACAADPAPLPRPPPVPAEETVRDVFGINEALAVPDGQARTESSARLLDAIEEDAERVRSLGVRHVRLHTAVWPWLSEYAWSKDEPAAQARTDAVLKVVFAADLVPHVMIGAWPGNGPQHLSPTCAPPDVVAYEAWVRRVVERYDGDGIDDAPGVGRVAFWEIDNEPDLHHRAPARGSNAGHSTSFCPPTRFVDVVTATAGVIRSADPTATVLHGGLFDPSHEDGAAYLKAMWADPRLGPAVDGINVHRYPPNPGLDAVWAVVDDAARLAPGEPVWITEVSSLSDGHGASARTQEQDLVGLVLGALTRGVRRVFWHSLVEPPGAGDRPSVSRTRHLFAGGPADIVTTGPRPTWKQVQPRPAAQAVAALLTRFGAVRRTAVDKVKARDGVIVARIGDALVAVGTPGGPSSAPLRVEGSWLVRPLVDDGRPAAAFEGTLDLSGGAIVLEPTGVR